MDRLKKKALVRAPKSINKKYLAKLKQFYVLRKALVEINIKVEKLDKEVLWNTLLTM